MLMPTTTTTTMTRTTSLLLLSSYQHPHCSLHDRRRRAGGAGYHHHFVRRKKTKKKKNMILLSSSSSLWLLLLLLVVALVVVDFVVEHHHHHQQTSTSSSLSSSSSWYYCNALVFPSNLGTMTALSKMTRSRRKMTRRRRKNDASSSITTTTTSTSREWRILCEDVLDEEDNTSATTPVKDNNSGILTTRNSIAAAVTGSFVGNLFMQLQTTTRKDHHPHLEGAQQQQQQQQAYAADLVLSSSSDGNIHHHHDATMTNNATTTNNNKMVDNHHHIQQQQHHHHHAASASTSSSTTSLPSTNTISTTDEQGRRRTSSSTSAETLLGRKQQDHHHDDASSSVHRHHHHYHQAADADADAQIAGAVVEVSSGSRPSGNDDDDDDARKAVVQVDNNKNRNKSTETGTTATGTTATGTTTAHDTTTTTRASTTTDDRRSRSTRRRRRRRESAFPPMDMETARELDEAVTILYPTHHSQSSSSSQSSRQQQQQQTSEEIWKKQITEQPLSPLYKAMQQQSQMSSSSSASSQQQQQYQPQPQPQHQSQSSQTQYQDRICRDMKLLSLSIAASTETLEQWRTFCKEAGGLYPLLEIIKDGAIIRKTQQMTNNDDDDEHEQQSIISTPGRKVRARWQLGRRLLGRRIMDDVVAAEEVNNQRKHQNREESFQAACGACRAIRDVCAISPELAAVVTDGILRANVSWKGGLFQNFCMMLQYANSNNSGVEAGAMDIADEGNDGSTAGVEANVRFLSNRRRRRDARLRCQLYVCQLLLAMTVASDDAVSVIRSTDGLVDAILACSSYADAAAEPSSSLSGSNKNSSSEQRRHKKRWLRYPGKAVGRMFRSGKRKVINNNNNENDDAMVNDNDAMASNNNNNKNNNTNREIRNTENLRQQVCRTANQCLAAIGYNRWIPKSPGQKGLRILCLDGGGSRGMTAITAVQSLMDSVKKTDPNIDVADCFDMIAGTSTGGIIAFLTGLRRETSSEALERYNQLIKQIFVKSALSTPLMFFTTATYDESPFMNILSTILGDNTMLDSRADPTVPLVCCLTSKMSSTPTHVSLFRNYNYEYDELSDPFTIDPCDARNELDLSLDLEHDMIRNGIYPMHKDIDNDNDDKVRPRRRRHRQTYNKGNGNNNNVVGKASRYPGSFRVLQRYALRASTAAPTVFKPVMMGGEMYCDGGIVASNPAAVAIHEAKSLFPHIPIELVVSVGTGAFQEIKSAPKIGWDGIIGQIVNSATDGEQIHHILEDMLGGGGVGEDPQQQQQQQQQQHQRQRTRRRRGDTTTTGDSSSSTTTQCRYYRFNPVVGLPDEFPIDVTDPEKLAKLRRITRDYMNEPEQRYKVNEVANILQRGRERGEAAGGGGNSSGGGGKSITRRTKKRKGGIFSNLFASDDE